MARYFMMANRQILFEKLLFGHKQKFVIINLMKVFSIFSKKFLIYASLGLIVLIIGVFSLRNGNGKQVATVVRADIVQEVAATGKVKPNQNVNLGFDKSGRVGEVYVSIGETVKEGQLLAALESGELLADLSKARASLLEENIKLKEVQSTAPISFNDSSKNLDAAIREGFADADDAVRNKADQFFKNTSGNPQFEISITSGNFTHYFTVSANTAIEINSARRIVEEVLTNWQKEISNKKSEDLIVEADIAINNLNAISRFLDQMAEAVNSFASADYTYDTTVSNYKLAISGARSAVSDAIAAIVTAKDKFTTASTLGQNGQFVDVLTQETKVSQAQAAVSSLEAALSKSSIRAPFDGVVTLQDAKVGGAVAAGAALISVVSQDQIYIEANISEIHIGKIAVGNPVTVTFDAFPDEEFVGTVSYIEPGDVIVDGVVNYKVRVTLDQAESKIKNGLTTNLKIQTNKKTSVVAVPLYALIQEGGQNFANKVVAKNIEKVPVSLGLYGNDGLVEILNGLEVGDTIEF